MLREERVKAPTTGVQGNALTAQQQAGGARCPQCGTMNDAEALFCASCGAALRTVACPHCGSAMDADADFCEVCHHYVKQNVCSFCGASLSVNDAFCPQCGNPRGGIVCPTCHTLNDFAFCKQCATPLTEEARMLVQEISRTPDYQLLAETAAELQDLGKLSPYTSERDVVRQQMNDKLRERVLTLLARDAGMAGAEIPKRASQRMSKEELQRRKEEKTRKIAELLDRMALRPMASPVKARNYAMAQKPFGVRLAWVCNWKHAMHSSPCGCAKPQMGGKWVILGKNSRQETKDDNQ